MCKNRQSLTNTSQGSWYYPYYQEDSGNDEDTIGDTRARVVKLSNLKCNAIDVTTDVIVVENLLRRHSDDLGLLMYHYKCSKEMHQALAKLAATSHRTLGDVAHKLDGNTVAYSRDIV